MTTLDTDRLHSVQSAAALLGGVSVSLIRKWIYTGRLTKVKVGSRTMVRESELREMARPEKRKNQS
jgi:excisionase family DNA binding protein